MPQPLDDALAQLRPVLVDPGSLVRAVASGRRRGVAPPAWRRVELRPVDLKDGRRLQVVTSDATQASTRNEPYGPRAEAAVDLLLAEPFGSWHVQAREETLQLRVTKRGEGQLHRAATPADGDPEDGDPEGGERARHAHDRAKPRLVDPAAPVLRELGISDSAGRVRPSRQAKYRQVEEMLRALDAVRGSVPAPGPDGVLRVVDLGCGNAYLTFVAYAHLSADGTPVELVGVDVKAQAREHGEKVAAALGWSDRVRFVRSAVLDADVERAGVVLALHACDTATDEALARAVRWQAPVVLASPCCHHDVQRQLAAGRAAPGEYRAVTRHGILRERWADVLTDALRAALLRIVGYRVEVVEFVGSQHTPRNTLIRAVRTGAPPTDEQVADYVALTSEWGLQPRLAVLLADLLPPAARPSGPAGG